MKRFGVGIVDCHSDVMMDVVERRRAGGRRVLADVHLPRWQEGQVAGALLTVGGDLPNANPPLADVLANIELLRREAAEAPDDLSVVTRFSDWERARGEGRFAAVMHLEGAAPVGEDLAVLGALHRLGVRSIGLTWNRRNQVADGVGEAEGGRGLTDFGVTFVQEMERLGLLIDLSHVGEAAFWQVLNVTRGPVVATHCNCRALHNHPRNLSDEQIRALAARGGFVGIAFYPAFLGSGDVTLEHVLDHVDHVRRLVGCQHVAIGADFIDFATEAVGRRLATSGISYGDPRGYPPGLEDPRGLPLLLEGLRRRGYREAEVEQIAHGNVERVLREVLR